MATNTEKIVIQVQVKGLKDVNKLEDGMKGGSKAAGGFTRSMIKAGAAIGSALIIFRQLNRTIGNAIRTFKDFEFQMAKVKAMTGASEKEYNRLSNAAQNLGRSTFFTASEVASLQVNLSKLGFTTEEVLNAEEAILLLATATSEDLARSATIVGAAIRGFNEDASEAARFADVMAVAFTSSALDLEKFATSMTKVSSIAEMLGFSFEETTSMLASLTDAGIEASIAGTALRQILLFLGDPTSNLSRKIGMTVESADDFIVAMEKMNKEGVDLSDILKVVNRRQVVAFNRFLNSTDALRGLIKEMNNATGAAEEMSDVVEISVEGAFRIAKSAWDGFIISVLEGNGTFSIVVQDMLNTFAKFLNKLSLGNKTWEDFASDKALRTLKNIRKETNETGEAVSLRLTPEIKTLKDELLEMEKAAFKEGGMEELITQVNAYEAATRAATVTARRQTGLVGGLLQGMELTTNAAGKENKVLKEKVDKYRELRGTVELLEKAQADALVIEEKKAEAANEEVRVRTSLIEIQKTLLFNAQQEPERTEKEIAAKNKKIQAIKEEIKRLKALGIVLDENIEKEKEYSSGALELLAEAKADIWNKLMGEVVDGTKSMRDAENELFQDQVDHINHLLESEVLSNEERTKLEKELTALKLKNMTDEEKKRKANQAAALQVGQELSDTLFTIDAQNRDRKQSQDLKILEERKEAGVITQEEYEKEVDSINEKAFIRAQSASISQALINGALAITKIFATAIPPISFGMLAPTIAATAAQVAVITNQEYAQGGMVYGDSHAQGGEKFAVGGRVVELEGGESVINKRSTAMYRPLLSSINSMGGGVKFADGGLLNQPSFAQSQFNALGQAGMMGAISQGNRVVVVESDITNSQNTVSTIQSQAGF